MRTCAMPVADWQIVTSPHAGVTGEHKTRDCTWGGRPRRLSCRRHVWFSNLYVPVTPTPRSAPRERRLGLTEPAPSGTFSAFGSFLSLHSSRTGSGVSPDRVKSYARSRPSWGGVRIRRAASWRFGGTESFESAWHLHVWRSARAILSLSLRLS